MGVGWWCRVPLWIKMPIIVAKFSLFDANVVSLHKQNYNRL